MFLDDYNLFRRGKLSNQQALESSITHLGGSLYAYMVMLETLDRKEEANYLEELRMRIFKIRTEIQDGDYERLSTDMHCIYRELEVLRMQLRVHKPAEAAILQSTNNEACGLVYVIKEFTP